MAETEAFVFRASLSPNIYPKIYRDFEISAGSSLYALAQAIVRFFDFDFDHAFGFYSKLKGNIYDSPCRYELFVDMGEGEHGARSVKRTRVIEAFPSVGAKMRFLFDYGDEWGFLVELVSRKPKEPKVKLPRLMSAAGKAPAQYPDPDDE
jgi:hypothetical protein